MTKFQKHQASNFPDNRTIYSPTYQGVNHVSIIKQGKKKKREKNKTAFRKHRSKNLEENQKSLKFSIN